MNIDDATAILGPMYAAIAADGAIVLDELGLSKDARILDVGTGSGNFAIFLAPNGFDVLTGEPDTDTSRYARQNWLANAKNLGVADRIRFQPFDASDMPFEAGSFDAVFFFGVLHHVDDALRDAVCGEALRAIGEDGAVVVFEPHEQALELIRKNDPGHPPSAEPSRHMERHAVVEKRFGGSLMDIFIYTPKT